MDRERTRKNPENHLYKNDLVIILFYSPKNKYMTVFSVLTVTP